MNWTGIEDCAVNVYSQGPSYEENQQIVLENSIAKLSETKGVG